MPLLQYELIESSFFGMNTEISYRIYGSNAANAATCVKSEIYRLEEKLSKFKDDSEICKLNQLAGKGPVKLSSETYEILAYSKKISEITDGMFNIMTGPLINLWDYKNAIGEPTNDSILQLLPLIDYHDLVLNKVDRTAELRKKGQSVDLGGIGKGYASDRCIEVMKNQGIISAFVNIGGNVSVLGNRSDHLPWCIGIQHPRKIGCLLGAVKVTNGSVVTSGDYERFFRNKKGKRYHHIFNPITGYPAESGLISVTIVSDSAFLADALSTALFIAGKERALEIMEHFSEIEAILVDCKQQVYITKGLNGGFERAKDIKVKLL